MEPISVVVTAPNGIADCVYLDDLSEGADGETLQIVVMDGASNYVDQSRRGIRHISAPGCRIHGLIAIGIRNAELEWVLVTEDHCRPLPGFLDAYREAIRAHPGVDLFSGATENLTSTAPWSFANFLVGLPDFWPAVEQNPKNASNANLLIRRSAIRPSELASEGGFLNLTLPRLRASARYAHCVDAVVDHVLPLSREDAISFQFHCAASGRKVRHATSPVRPLPVELLRDVFVLGYLSAVKPVQTIARLRGTEHFSVSMAFRIMALGATHGAGLLWADLGDIANSLSRSRPGTPAATIDSPH